MDRVEWVKALGEGQESLFLKENILGSFISTGYRAETILARDPKVAFNIPQLYEKLKNLTSLSRKLLDTLEGGTRLLEIDIEGDFVKYTSFRLGHQRRLNIITPLEKGAHIILNFISSTFSHFPDSNKPIGVYGDPESGVPLWSQEIALSFLSSAALSDANSMIQRLSLELGLGKTSVGEIHGKNSQFLLSITSDDSNLLLIQTNNDQMKWTTRLTKLFSRVSKDSQFQLPKEIPQLKTSPNKVVSTEIGEYLQLTDYLHLEKEFL